MRPLDDVAILARWHDLKAREVLLPPTPPLPTVGMVITRTRGPRFVDRCACPMCGVDNQGLEYQGVLMSGAKVHTIAAHTAGMRRVERGQPRCLGAGMKMEFVGGQWKGAAP